MNKETIMEFLKKLTPLKGNEIEKAEAEITTRYKAIKTLNKISPFGDKAFGDKQLTINLILTDLFVEKDLRALGRRALLYQITGAVLYLFALSIFSMAAFFSYVKFISLDSHVANIQNSTYMIDWAVPVRSFIISFTFYGLMILLGATSWKHGKAHFDQAERLYSKRQIDRFLRLYIHMNNAKLTLDDIKNILELPDTKNAFTDIKAEAKAPWGNVITELIQSNSKIVESISKNGKVLDVRKSDGIKNK